MGYFATKSGNVEVISRWILAILCVCTILETFIYPDVENLYGCFTFIVTWMILSAFVMKQKNVNKCFLPFWALFGIGVCFFFLPLPITMIEGKPLTFRFQCPYMTFNYQFLNLIMLILAYKVCCRIYKPNNFLTNLWTKMGYFTLPTDKQIWVMGIIGVYSHIVLLSFMGTDEAQGENLGFIGHLFGVVKVFSYFPILLLFKKMYTGKPMGKIHKPPIIIYLIILAALGLATGKRTAIFTSFVTLLMCYVVPIFTENRKIFSRKIFLISVLGIYLITGPIADLAIAIALGRDNAMTTSAEKTFDKIVKLYDNKENLHTMYQMILSATDNGGDNLSGWSEYYVDNIVLDRFCNLRVCDMTIDYAHKLGFNNPVMHEYTSNQLLFLLPTPILKLLGIHINKFELQYTPGDLISTNALNLESQYYGYRVAGDVGIGLYLWGHMYYIYGFIIYTILFFFLSSIVKVSNMGFMVFPLPVLVDLFRYYLLFNNSTGMIGVLSTILRTGWQAIVVYCVFYFIVRKIVR